VLALGDSLTAGYGLAARDGFVPRLEAALRTEGYNVTVVNAGVSGDTTAGGKARLDWSLAEKPDAVLLELGANDALRGISPVATEANLDAMLQVLRKRQIPVLLIGMKSPPNLGTEYVTAFEGIYPRLAARYQIPLYPFFLDGVAASSTLNQPDGIHPNAQGVHEIVRRLLPVVGKFLDALS
jgi:acyl-CoA thioesterase-1